ncbi:ABC transporter ATP-binding protein [Austwickia chelonae]|uniref:ABC transporter ATP-binding protein n=1 Tax=Austwickia chelonae TaxID=100225 RepID=UPI001FE1AF74|nr:ATP-binding cassette domain-containing protein [Austwickia chelonae]
MAIDGSDIFDNVDLTCAPGSMTALVGPSGCGKTTLLHCLGLLQFPTNGRILVDGKDTVKWSSSQRRQFWRRHAAFVLQDYGIMEDESLGFNVTMRASFLGGRIRGDLERLEEALHYVGLDGRAYERASHLSGGEKQRLAVARAIYKRADVIYVDEPTASLDEKNRHTVARLFKERASAGCTVVVATHDEEMVAQCTSSYRVGLVIPGQAATCASSGPVTSTSEGVRYGTEE